MSTSDRQLKLDVYRQLFDGILEQRLAPNTKLNEQEIAEIFGVSRTLVRQALQRLAAEQVVVIQRNRGAFVAVLSPSLAQQILVARELIELEVTDLLCGQLSQAQYDLLQSMITLEQEAIANGDSGSALRRSGEFHLRLAEVAGNQPYLHMLRGLVSQTSLLITTYGKGGNSCACDEHFELLQSLWQGNKRNSKAQMRRHLGHIIKSCDFSRQVASSDLQSVFGKCVAAS